MSTKRDRVILPLLLPSESTEDTTTFDVPSLFLHLLLFDTVIVPTVRLQDIAAVVRTVGLKPTLELLDADCVYVRSPLDQLATSGTTQPDVCEMIYLWSSDPDKILSIYLQEISALGLRRPDRDTLKRIIVKRWLASGKAELYMLDAMKTAEREAIDRSPTFMAALDLKLGQAGQKLLTRDQIAAERIGTSGQLKFRIEGVDNWTPELTKAVRAATVSVAGLEAQFGHMERDNAVGGIKEDSLAIMEWKLKSLWQALRPDEKVEQFYRVQSIAELPDFGDELRNSGLDMKKFLEVRQSAECREFREFVSKSASLSDDELRSRTTSLRAKIGNRVSSAVGKTLRVLGTTAAGMLPAAFSLSPEVGLAAGALASLTASGADAFLVDKVFPSKGIISFIGSQYPSIFK